MARIYDVVCPRCGEIHQWCKHDPPIEKCEFCGYELSRKEKDGELVWKNDVHIFCIWSTTLEVEELSKRLRKEYFRKKDDENLPEHLFAKIHINILTPLDSEHQEELEDMIKILLKEYGVKAKIRSMTTGNEMPVFY
jgi:hypothetical protein